MRRRRVPTLLVAVGLLAAIMVLTMVTGGGAGGKPLAPPALLTTGSAVASLGRGGQSLTSQAAPAADVASPNANKALDGDAAAAGMEAAVAAANRERDGANAAQNAGEGAAEAAPVAQDGPTPIPRPAAWLRAHGANPHFSLDPAIMPDEFLAHLQYMSSKIASEGRWAGNGWTRFDKRDISRCSEPFMTGDEAARGLRLTESDHIPALGDGTDEGALATSYLSRAAGTEIVGLPECQMWRAIRPQPWIEKKKRKKGAGKKGEEDEADDDGLEALPPVPLTAAELDRPYRKCCVEHARLRDTAFFVFDHLEANNITYFLSTGTALGALRHNGTIIPWDTDVDISIYPRDAAKARALFKGLSQHGKGKNGNDNAAKPDSGGRFGTEDGSIAALLGKPASEMSPFLRMSLNRHHFSPDPNSKPMFWVHGSKDGFPRGGPHIEIFHESVYTDYPDALLPLGRCSFYGRQVFCPSPKMFAVWFPSGSDVYGGGHYHGKSRCTIFIKGVKHETDKC